MNILESCIGLLFLVASTSYGEVSVQKSLRVDNPKGVLLAEPVLAKPAITPLHLVTEDTESTVKGYIFGHQFGTGFWIAFGVFALVLIAGVAYCVKAGGRR